MWSHFIYISFDANHKKKGPLVTYFGKKCNDILLKCIKTLSKLYHFSIWSQFTVHYCCFYIPKRYQWQTSVTPFNAWPKMVLVMLSITCNVRPTWLLPPWLFCKTEVIYKYLPEICHHGIELSPVVSVPLECPSPNKQLQHQIDM